MDVRSAEERIFNKEGRREDVSITEETVQFSRIPLQLDDQRVQLAYVLLQLRVGSCEGISTRMVMPGETIRYIAQ